MKKMILSLAVACISAATAFADGPTWFAEAVNKTQVTSGAWTINADPESPASLADLMGSNAFITYKDMENDLVFTANTAQTLPGDEATVNTTVKFTAMAMEDFVDLTNKNEDAWADAKGGLTIIEEPEGTYNFYGIVNGYWVALGTAQNAKAVIEGDTAVDVEVKIWENNGRKISYKVSKTANETTTTYLNETDKAIAESVAGSTISQIAYRGNCEISSLTGDTAPEMWNITLTGLLNAVATLKIGSTSRLLTDDEKTSKTVSITGTTENVSIAYAAPAAGDWMFFRKNNDDKTGKDKADSTQVTVDGDKAINAVPADYDYAKVVAKIGDASYQSLADAFLSALSETKQKIDVVAKPTDTALTMTKNVQLDANDYTVGANFTLDTDTTLEILGGNYTGTFTEGKVSFGGVATFTKITSDVAKLYCAAGFFARANGDGCSIVEGTVPSQEIPFSYDPAIVEGGDAKAFFARSADNGLTYETNYLLGLDPDSTKAPEFESEANATTLAIDTLVPGNPGTGWKVQMNGAEINLEDAAATGFATVKIQLTDGEKTVDAFEKKVGVKSASVSDKEDTEFQMVSVPYTGLSNEESISLDQAINKENLADGDMVMVYDTTEMSYLTWKLNSAKQWVYQVPNTAKNSVSDDIPAAEYPVKPGQGLWLKSAQEFYQYGSLVDTYNPTACAKDTWNLIANPAGPAESILVNKISGMTAGDVIRVESQTGAPTEYTYDGEYWKVFVPATYKIETISRGGKEIEVKVADPEHPAHFETVTEINSTGFGTWYIPSEDAKTGATIAW